MKNDRLSLKRILEEDPSLKQEIGWKDIAEDEDIEWVRTVKAWAPAKAPEREFCEDCISRQAVLAEAFEVDTKEYGRIDVVGVDAINALPPITPQPMIGRWIAPDGKNAICGCCNRLNRLYGTYCKHCGAKMQEVKE